MGHTLSTPLRASKLRSHMLLSAKAISFLLLSGLANGMEEEEEEEFCLPLARGMKV